MIKKSARATSLVASQAIVGEAFEVQVLHGSVTAFREAAAAIPLLPRCGVIRHVAGQAATAVWQGATDIDDLTNLVRVVQVGTGGRGLLRFLADFSTTPLGAPSLVIVAVRRQRIAVGAEGVAVFVVTAAELDGWVVVSHGGADSDHAPCTGAPDGVKTALETQCSIGEEFADGEPGETGL